MAESKSICPCALGFILKTHLTSDLISSGSVGIGCTVDKFVEVKASESKQSAILFNGRKTQIAPVQTAIRKITTKNLTLEIKSELPIGCGFGVSGASTLASLFAVNNLLNLNLERMKLLKIAHTSEIIEKTGLGTVATQTTGGFLYKQKAGIPPLYTRFPFAGKKIYATVIGEIKTEKILSDRNLLNKINQHADLAFLKIEKIKNISLKDILNISFEFCRDSNLLKSAKVKNLINAISKKGGAATMAILGNTVLSNIRPQAVNYQVFELIVTDKKI